MFLVCFRYYYLFSLSYIIQDHITEAVNIVFSCFCCVGGKEEAHKRTTWCSVFDSMLIP